MRSHFSAVSWLNVTYIFKLIVIYEYLVPVMEFVICLQFVPKLVMYKTCSLVKHQLRVRTAGVSLRFEIKLT